MGEKNCVVKMQVDYGNGEKLDAVFRSVPEDTPAEVIKLINRRRSGDLIPRDEITPQMAAEWQPIETAAGELTPGDSALVFWDCVIFTALFVGGGWMSRGKSVYPTHWMPLPEPPAIKETRDE